METEQLQKLLEDIQKHTTTANIDLDNLPPSVRGGWGSSKREAAEKLVPLKQKYAAALMSGRAGVFLLGPSDKQADFGAVFTKYGDLVADADALYSRLATPVEAAMGDTRQWGVTQSHQLILGLKEVMTELNLTELDSPSHAVMPILEDAKAVKEHIRSIVRQTLGDSLNRLYIEAQFAKAATEICYTNSTSPALVVNAREDEIAGLGKAFGRGILRTITLSAEDEVNVEFVLNKVMQQKTEVSPKKKQTKTQQTPTGEE